MKDLCAQCNICTFMPEQTEERPWFIGQEEPKPLILVIDDTTRHEKYEDGMGVAETLIGKTPFAYTTTIRCNYTYAEVEKENISIATSRCAVWTNALLDGRRIVISTVRGLQQAKVGMEKKEGDMFKSGKIGLVLVVPPLLSLSNSDIGIYQTKVARLLKDAALA